MKAIWIAVLAVVVVALGAIAQTESESKSRDGVFIHISHGTDDPHRALMALRMAELMSEDHDVLVYFDITGIDLVLKDAPDVTFKEFPASKAQIQKLIGQKVTLMACPGCLTAAGKSAADLAPGIKIAKKQVFLTITKRRNLSLDN